MICTCKFKFDDCTQIHFIAPLSPTLIRPPRPHVPLFAVGHSQEVLYADAGTGTGVVHVNGSGFDFHHNSDVADAPTPAAAEEDKVNYVC